jgi:hypothetical protein
MFALLILVPDLSMLGYLRNPRTGALVYNIGHSYAAPLLLLGISVLFNAAAGIMVSLVWIAHIALDRVLGFGLKLPTGFKDTHLRKL